jgi:hypothetical protein
MYRFYYMGIYSIERGSSAVRLLVSRALCGHSFRFAIRSANSISVRGSLVSIVDGLMRAWDVPSLNPYVHSITYENLLYTERFSS